jgi:hypothetical protein
VTHWLDQHGYNSWEELKKRDVMSMVDKAGYAADIVDHMLRDGFSKETWQVFRDIVDDSRASRY